MKRLVLILFFVLNLHIALHADIDDRIKAIQHAPAAERYKLMNAFKREIVQMKEHERIEALKKLSHINRSKNAQSVLKELTKHSRRAYSKQHDDERRSRNEDAAHEESNSENSESIENDDTETTVEESSSETEDSVENETGNETEESIEDQTGNEAEESVENETEEHVEHETEERNEEEHDDD